MKSTNGTRVAVGGSDGLLRCGTARCTRSHSGSSCRRLWTHGRRQWGYDLAHEFRRNPYSGRLELHTAVFRKKKTRLQAGGYWRALWRHVWTPWLKDNEWTPQPGVREDPLHPLWISPSGAVYELWNLLGKPRDWRWNGLGIALTRAGFDLEYLSRRAKELSATGFTGRIERWRNGPPPPPHEVNKILIRAWSWGAGPFLGQDVAA